MRDSDGEHPIAAAWRPILAEIVRCFSRGDYSCRAGVHGVAPITAATAAHIRAVINDYGATLIELPEATWDTSVAQWMGSHWEVLVDLWTADEGRSDLVLHADVEEVDGNALVSVHLVYVP